MAQRLTRRIPDPKTGGSNPSSLTFIFFFFFFVHSQTQHIKHSSLVQMVRIPGFPPGDPGSIPGRGIHTYIHTLFYSLLLYMIYDNKYKRV